MKITNLDGEFWVSVPNIGNFLAIPAIENMKVEAEQSHIQTEIEKRDNEYAVKITVPCTVTRYIQLNEEQLQKVIPTPPKTPLDT